MEPEQEPFEEFTEPRGDGSVQRLRVPKWVVNELRPPAPASFRSDDGLEFTFPATNDDMGPLLSRWLARGAFARIQTASYDAFVNYTMPATLMTIRNVVFYDHSCPDGPRMVVVLLGPMSVGRPVFPQTVSTTGMRVPAPPELMPMRQDPRPWRFEQPPSEPVVDPDAPGANGAVRPLFPADARRRGISYCAPVFVDIIVEIRGPTSEVIETRTERRVHIGDIPVMVGSSLCNTRFASRNGGIEQAGEDPYAHGGTFVIGGADRVLVAQESSSPNNHFVYRTGPTPSEQPSGVPAIPDRYQPRLRVIAEVRSTIEGSNRLPNLCAVRLGSARLVGRQQVRAGRYHVGGGGVIVVVLPFARKEVNLAVMLMALGVVGQENILKVVVGEDGPPWSEKGQRYANMLVPTLEESAAVAGQDEALRIIAQGAGGGGRGASNASAKASGASVVRPWGKAANSAAAASAAAQRKRSKQTGIGATPAGTTAVQGGQGGGRASTLQSAPIDRLDSERANSVDKMLSQYLLPHMGAWLDATFPKALYLGYMTRRLLQVVLGERADHRRDDYRKKLVDTTGELLAQLWRSGAALFRGDLQAKVDRLINGNRLRGGACTLAAIPPIRSLVNPGLITRICLQPLSSGFWPWGGYVTGTGFGVVGAFQTPRAGVVQTTQIGSHIGGLAHCMRVNTHVLRAGKTAQPRQIDPTHWGRLCPSETPEGPQCGLVKNVALACQLSLPLPPMMTSIIKTLMEDLGTRMFRREDPCDPHTPLEESRQVSRRLRHQPLPEIDRENIRIQAMGNAGPPAVLVFLSGALVGAHPNGPELAAELVRRRRLGEIPRHVGINLSSDGQAVDVRTTVGRALRPLLVVDPATGWVRVTREDADPLGHKDIDDLVEEGKADLVDAAEESSLVVAMTIADLRERRDRYTHAEIHIVLALGVTASCTPFANRTLGPRLCYSNAMLKQGMGIPHLVGFRLDTLLRVLMQPTQPLASTMQSRVLGVDAHGAGCMALVAMVLSDGFAQNDSIMIKREYLARGAMRSFVVHTLRAGEDTAGQQFCCPGTQERYRHLRPDGMPRIGSFIEAGDAVIGKVHDGGNDRITDASLYARKDESGEVLNVQVGKRPSGKFARVQVGHEVVPSEGDKFATRQGQKGVIGGEFWERDGPHTVDGRVPDIVFNPFGLAARQTMNMAWEGIMSKLVSVVGRLSALGLDGTAFSDSMRSQALCRLLRMAGHAPSGCEQLYDGRTGQPLHGLAVLVPIYYLPLRHLVADKFHARAYGPVAALTRQPTEGRSRDGGLRLGEMERDVLLANGSVILLMRRLVGLSDGCRMLVCGGCGHLAVTVPHTGEAHCSVCDTDEFVHTIHNVPYAWKLAVDEHGAMGITARLIPEQPRQLIPGGTPKGTVHPYQVFD